MNILIFKAIHIIGFVTWFAALFYLPRLMVYHLEALDKAAPERDILAKQYAIMENRLYKIIMNPAMLLTLIAGIALLIISPGYLKMGWLHLKLTLIIILIGYHHMCRSWMRKLGKGTIPMTSERMRLINEVPTIILIMVVSLAIFRDQVAFWQLSIGTAGLIVLLYLAAMWYKKIRTKNV